MLINIGFTTQIAYGQTGLNSIVNYEARDSIVANVPKQIVTLYGEAYVQYEGIELKADYIEISMKNNEVTATYSLDSLGNPVGKPLFTSEGEESQCEYVKYNFDTKKGYIREVRAQQDEGYIHMAESKIHPNEQIHLKNGKFTTCENDTPHYHFKLSKAIIVPDKRVVTGPVFMKIGKIPTPLAAPFAFFPNSDSRKHGLIIPSFAAATSYGFGLQDLGYYIPLGDYWETQFLGTIFTSGRFAIENNTNYYRKYKGRGSFGVRFEQLTDGFYDTTIINKTSLRWTHTQDPKAHPSIKFSASINFKSDNNGKTTLETQNQEIFDNQFNSSIKLSKSWSTRKLRGSASLNTSLQQSSGTGNYNINLPDFNFSISQFDLGVFRKNQIGKKWYEQVNVRYGLRGNNQIVAPDTLFRGSDLFSNIGDYALNGFEHKVTVNSNLKLFGGRITFTPSANYREIWNMQYEEHVFDSLDNDFDTTSLRGFGTARNASFSANLTTGFYGMYKFKGKNKTRFKHVANPSLAFGFTPNLSSYVSALDSNDNVVKISPFNSSRYKEASDRESATMRWNLTNTLKMKTRDRKDTINESDKSFNLIDQLSISGSYDFLADSLNISDQSISFRTSKLFKIFSFQSSATLSPYVFDSLNNRTSDYAYSNGDGFGKITRTQITVNANFTSSSGRKKQKELSDATANNADLTDQMTDPNKTNFDIPWQINVSYNVNHNIQRLDSIDDPIRYLVIQTLKVSGDFSINEKWKFRGGISFDLQQLNPLYRPHTNPEYFQPLDNFISTYDFEIWRDLHCWEAVLQFRQIGPVRKSDMGHWTIPAYTDDETGQFFEKQRFWNTTNWMFLFRVNIKASMFQDIKLEYDQPPLFF